MLNPHTHFHFLNAAGDFNVDVLDGLTAEAKKSLLKIHEFLPEDNLDLVFLSAPKTVNGNEPIWGYSRNASTIFVYIDLGYQSLDALINNDLKRVLAHEYHHARRWKSVGYGTTLGEVLITEGLADHFSMEVFSGDMPKWCCALTEGDIETWLEKAISQLNDKGYNHAAWFFGDKRTSTPKWTGYSLGYFLIKQYMEKNRGITATQLVDVPAASVLADLGYLKEKAV